MFELRQKFLTSSFWVSCRRHYFGLSILGLSFLYLFLRLYNLLILPIFADEAIYIYWSQLAISDWSRYGFYALNDGKTPLFIWTMIPFLKLFANPLFAGRFVSVLFGLGQLLITIKLVGLFTQQRILQLLGGLLVIFLPGFVFNQRLALIDTQLTFFLSLSFYFSFSSLSSLSSLSLSSVKVSDLWTWLVRSCNRWTILSGIFLGLALLTKFSAVLFLPVLVTLIFYFDHPLAHPPSIKKPTWFLYILNLFKLCLPLAIVIFLGLLGLLTLKISPGFSQLFSRGSDFLYPLSQFFSGPISIIASNWQGFIQILINYLTGTLFLFSLLLAILALSRDRRPLLLIFSGCAFLLPILFLGKIIYPRYLLPVVPFFVISFCISLTYFSSRQFRFFKLILFILIFVTSGVFVWHSLFDPAHLNLVPKDQQQYLDEWSAGYGIWETVVLIEQLAQKGPVLVLTEGHIGSLPDGLQVYFFNRPIRNQIRIEGIGQPIVSLTQSQDLIDSYPQAILVVNSHRLQTEISDGFLLAEFPRPLSGTPSLQVWQLK